MPRPHVRGLREPDRSQRWAALGRTSAVRPRLMVELSAGGMAPRASASAWAQALGQFVGAQSAVRDMPDRLRHASEAVRPRAWSGGARAYRLMETV